MHGLAWWGAAPTSCWVHDGLRRGGAAQVMGADPGDGCRAEGPLLDDARMAEPSDPSAVLGGPQAPGATAQALPGRHGMTTVHCDAASIGSPSSQRGPCGIPWPSIDWVLSVK